MSEEIKTQDTKIEFSPEQQTKIDEIVRNAMGRAAADLRTQLTTKEKELAGKQEELEAAKAAAANSGPNSQELETLRGKKVEADRELETIRKQLITTKKENLIHQIGGDTWVDNSVVLAMVDRNLRWNDATKTFDVVNLDGTPKISMSTFGPSTVKEFLEEFARNKPYLVRSDAKSGNGSTESNRSTFSNGKTTFTCEEIFGRKSESRKAAALYKQDPAQYARLKAEARAKGLIS